MLRGLGVESRRIDLLVLLSGDTFLTKDEINKRTGRSGDYVYEILNELYEYGWIERKGTGKAANPYRFRAISAERITRKLIKHQ
jgi:predicted transcriptional regulator